MTDLPRPNQYSNGGSVWHAYNRCLNFEEESKNSTDREATKRLRHARILGYLLCEAPTDEARVNMSNEINSCSDDTALSKLADFYFYHFIRTFRAAKGDTPLASYHSSRPSFDNQQDMLKWLIDEAPQNHSTAKSKALIRDGFRCMITGKYDQASCAAWPTLLAEALSDPRFSVTVALAAHILPESTNAGISGDNVDGHEHNYAAGVWAVMARLGELLITEELNGNNIHRLENILTLDCSKRVAFEQLYLWFEAMENNPHKYNVCTTNDLLFLNGVVQPVTFTSQNSNFPLPDPRYLGIHAACARVAHLSGAGEYADKIMRDLEESRVLAEDGTSADILAHGLSRVSIFQS